MGSFFTNLQICLDDGVDDARARVLGALRKFAAREGLVAAKGRQDPNDRGMLVRIDGNWASIYDELSESQDLAVSDALATAVSRELASAVVTVLVHDSDVLELRLFQRGELVDRFSNAPSYFARATPAAIAAAKGRPERWRKALGTRVDVDELRAAWQADHAGEPFAAHTILEETAGALGLADAAVTIGYNHATEPSESARSSGAHPGSDEMIELRWRSAKKPKIKAAAPPSFARSYASGGLDLGVGVAREVHCSARNEGAASKGLSLVVSGPALDEELVILESLTIALGVPAYEGTRVELERWNDAEGRPSYIATLPDAAIPEGISVDALGALARNPKKYVDASGRAEVRVTLACRGAKPGRSRLSIAFVPDANPEGEVVHVVSVNVSVTPETGPKAALRNAPRPTKRKRSS